LKPEFANLLSKVEMQGRSVREVAEEEGISANNAAVRLHRARLALKSQLEKTCGTCTEHGCLDCTCETSQKKGCH
jgi:DNA-directed RNA polymerase specialized sigma24 family protein